MKKEYWIILIVYIIMQLSSLIGIPITVYLGTKLGATFEEMKSLAIPIWLVFSFTLSLIIILWLLRKEKDTNLERKASVTSSISWIFAGIFLAVFAQTIAANIEAMLGIEMKSDNTEQILGIIEAFPIMIWVSSVIGPILEEIVFRKIIFGTLYKRFNFFLAAFISSVIFAIAHMELEHIILYSAIGFTFAYLYIKTNRIIVPIIAHVTTNTLVVITQSVYKEDIEQLLRQLEQLQTIIGGF